MEILSVGAQNASQPIKKKSKQITGPLCTSQMFIAEYKAEFIPE